MKNTFVKTGIVLTILFAVQALICIDLGLYNSINAPPTTEAGIVFWNPEPQLLESTYFLGESTTYGLQYYGILPGGKNTDKVWTGAKICDDGKVINAGTLSLSPSIDKTLLYYPTTKEAITLEEALRRDMPKQLVITLGLNNGASYYTEKQFKYCYRLLLNTVLRSSPETTIVLQSLFPVSKECNVKAYTPDRIRECNGWLRDIALEFSLPYVDSFSILSDENGFLLSEYDNKGDGIHLNKQGYTRIIKHIFNIEGEIS